MPDQTSRRSFLGAAGVAGLSAVTATSSEAAIEPEPWGIKLGVASYSLRHYDRGEAIELLKVIGSPWLSVKDVHLSYTSKDSDFEKARKEFAAAGLKVMSAGNVDMTKDKPETLGRFFEYAKKGGIPMLVCAPTHDQIDAIERLIKEYDIKVAIHNHGPEDKHFPTPQSVLEVVRNRDPRFGLCMDVGHSARTGVDVVKTIAEAGPRLLDMHIKDLYDFSNKDARCDVGDGKMPIPQIFRQLKSMNYPGCVNLEYEVEAKGPLLGFAPLLGMQKSMSYMRGALAALAST